MKTLRSFFNVVALISTLGLAQAQVPAYVPAIGLQGWWPFTGNANDQSGNGNNGTVYGAALTTDRNASVNCAYMFNGTTDYISCILSSLPVGNAPRSIAAWMSTTSGPIPTNIDPTVITIAAYGVNTVGNVVFGQFVRASTGKGYFESGSAQNQMNSLTTINDGSWHHVVLTYGGPGTRVKMYIDGLAEDSTAILSLATGNSFFGIGKSPWTNTYYQGKIDDVGFWNRALTKSEITNLYYGCLSVNATTSPNQTVTPGTAAQLTVSASATVSSYQWQSDLGLGYQNLSNAGQYNGVTSATLTVANTNQGNDNQLFRCVITSGGCTYTSNPTQLRVKSEPTGFADYSIWEGTQLYPNPAKSQVTIRTTQGNTPYRICNPLGQVVLSGWLNVGETSLNLDTLTSGMYTLVLEHSGQAIKFVKTEE